MHLCPSLIVFAKIQPAILLWKLATNNGDKTIQIKNLLKFPTKEKLNKINSS